MNPKEWLSMAGGLDYLRTVHNIGLTVCTGQQPLRTPAGRWDTGRGVSEAAVV